MAMKDTHNSANSSFPTLQALGGIECIDEVITRELNGALYAVNGPKSIVERRQHPRGGLVTRLEDITYSVLRDHELIGKAA